MFLHAAHASQQGYETIFIKFPDIDMGVLQFITLGKHQVRPFLQQAEEISGVSLISKVYLRNTEKIPVKHCLVCTHLQDVKVQVHLAGKENSLQ